MVHIYNSSGWETGTGNYGLQDSVVYIVRACLKEQTTPTTPNKHVIEWVNVCARTHTHAQKERETYKAPQNNLYLGAQLEANRKYLRLVSHAAVLAAFLTMNCQQNLRGTLFTLLQCLKK